MTRDDDTPDPSSPAEPVRKGARLGDRFLIGDELGGGQGGMGKVFEAFDEELRRSIAVKVLRDHTGGPLDESGSLREEAVILAQLQHPNIVAVHEIVRLPDATCLVMDLVQGVALNDVLARVKQVTDAREERPRRAKLLHDALGLPVPEGRTPLAAQGRWFDAVARIALDISRCLEAAHGAGVLHRDMKPRNIMLRGDGSPVVLDFGLGFARASGRTEPRSGLQGSAAYLAPEQIAAESLGDDPRTDVYQLGLLLYELLTLHTAFTGRSLPEVLRRIERGEFTRPRALDRGIPFELEAICLAAMERDPDRRYASAADFSEDLRRWIEGTGLPEAARGGRVASALRRTRYALRRRRVVVTTALALVVGVTAAAYLLDEPAPEFLRWYAADDGVGGEIDWSPVSVGPGDVLGFEITCTEPRIVYALSAFGERSPPTWLSPQLLSLSTEDPFAKDPDRAFGMPVEAGVHSVHCTQVGDAEEAIAFEGLWVFVSEDTVPEIEQWMRRIYDRGLDSGSQRVLFAHARQAYQEVLKPVTHRGGPVRLDPEQRRDLADRLEASAIMRDVEWPYESTRRYDYFTQVAP